MTDSLPSLSSLDERLSIAGDLSATWLEELWDERPSELEALLCEAFDLSQTAHSAGDILRQLTSSGAAGFESILNTELASTLRNGGVLISPTLIGDKVDLDEIFPGLPILPDQPGVLGFDRVFEDRFSGFTSGWSGDGNGGGQLLLNRAWAEHATVIDLAEMLLEQAGHWLQESLGLPEPKGDEGKIFAEGILKLQAGLVPTDATRIVDQGTVDALRLRDDAGYLFDNSSSIEARLSLELGELSDQFFERLSRGLAYGDIPLLDFNATTLDATEAAFGFSNTALLSSIAQRDAYAGRVTDGSNAYAVDQKVQLRSNLIDASANLLRLIPSDSPTPQSSQGPSPGQWDRNDFGFFLKAGDVYTSKLSQPLVLDLERQNDGAESAVKMTRANGTIFLDRNIQPDQDYIYAVPFWTAAEPRALLGYKLFEDAAAALTLFNALTASKPDQSTINAAAAAALQLSIHSGADPAAADQLVLKAERLYGLWGWQPETLREDIRIEAIYGATAESDRDGASDPFGVTSPSGFLATHAVLRGTGLLPVTGLSSDPERWNEAMVRPSSSYPILAIQGTNNTGGILDDANPFGVGIVQYLTNVGQIMADLTAWSLPGLEDGSTAPLSITGHSLGGGLAQQFALTALDPLGTLQGIEANLLSGPLASLTSSLSELVDQPISGNTWLGLLGAGINTAVLADALSGDSEGNDIADNSDASMGEKLAELGSDLVASLQGYGEAIALLGAAGREATSLPLYRLVTQNSPGVQDWQVAALEQPWDRQVIGDVIFHLTLGDVVGLAGDLHLPGEASLIGFDPQNIVPQLPELLSGVISGVTNFHTNLRFQPQGLTAYTNLAEAAGEQLIHLVDNQQPMRLTQLPAPGPEALGLQRMGVLAESELPAATDAIAAGFGSPDGNFDDSADLDWLLYRQHVLHLVGLVDDVVNLLRQLMAPPARDDNSERTRHEVSIDLGALNTNTDLVRIEDPDLRAHIGSGRTLSFTLAAGTRLPNLTAGSRTWRCSRWSL